MAEKAVLISGPPGIGKTTAAHLACRQLSMETVEMNASDTRSKLSLQDHVRDIIDNRTLTGFSDFFSKVLGRGMFDKVIQENGQAAGKRKYKRQVLIMDEVDGMSSGDRGGMMELIQLIKKSKV
jgi:replication factor C subunit 1